MCWARDRRLSVESDLLFPGHLPVLGIVAVGSGLALIIFGISSFLIYRWVCSRLCCFELQLQTVFYFGGISCKEWKRERERERAREREREREIWPGGARAGAAGVVYTLVSVQVNRGSVRYSPYAICHINYISHWHFPTLSNNVKPPRPRGNAFTRKHIN